VRGLAYTDHPCFVMYCPEKCHLRESLAPLPRRQPSSAPEAIVNQLGMLDLSEDW